MQSHQWDTDTDVFNQQASKDGSMRGRHHMLYIHTLTAAHPAPERIGLAGYRTLSPFRRLSQGQIPTNVVQNNNFFTSGNLRQSNALSDVIA